MASAHHSTQQRYSLPTPPSAAHNSYRLPSLKDLNFSYRPPPTAQDSPPLSNASGQSDHSISALDHSPRHAPQSWGRPSPTAAAPSSITSQQPHTHHHQHPHSQHSPSLSTGHVQQTSKSVDYTSKHDSAGYLTPGIPLSAQLAPVPGSVNIGPGARGEEGAHSQNTHKRSRTAPSMSSMPRDERQSHPQHSHPQQYASYPSSPSSAPYQVHQQQPPHDQVHHQPVAGPSHPGYGTYQHPPYMQSRPHNVHPQPPTPAPAPLPTPSQHPHPHHHQPSHGNPYPPPPSQVQEHWQHHSHQQQHQQQQHPQAQNSHHPHHSSHPQNPQNPQHPHMQHPQHPHPQHHAHQHTQLPPPQQQQHAQMTFAARTTALVPTTVDARVAASFTAPQNAKPSVLDSTMAEIVRNCNALYSFANHYVQVQATMPNVQPSAEELAEMNTRAVTVVRLLEEFRRMSIPEDERDKLEASSSMEDHRPPKRPWEDISQGPGNGGGGTEAIGGSTESADKSQSTAEQDMELIRTKRATSAAGGTTTVGQPKSKYRKRSRATPPGKCHSCSIRETPEWRRGPDGARTLCNACGLHYAKLMRKRNKTHVPGEQAPRIGIETLRASARAADMAEKSQSRPKPAQMQVNQSTSPLEQAKQLPQHHQGSFQLVSVMPTPAPGETGRGDQSMAPPSDNAAPMTSVTTWSTSTPSSNAGRRSYPPDQLQHQSFMRTSHSNGPSPR